MTSALRAIVLALLAFPLFAQPVRGVALALTFDDSATDSVAGSIAGRLVIANTGSVALTSVGFTLETFERIGDFTVTHPAVTCTTAGRPRVECMLGALEPRASIEAQVRFEFPQRSGRTRLRMNADYTTSPGGQRFFGASEDVEVAFWRRFVVTSTDDAGEGTLRNAIVALNADPLCATLPCSIDFAIPATSPWVTIKPLTALPAIVAGDLKVDGTTQPDTNPLGPDVELLGTTLGVGNGLDIRSPRMIARGLAIGGFPDNGIFYLPTQRGSRFTIEQNYIGVDPAGVVALPNGSRGIVVEQGIVSSSDIRDNVVSGNRRSGIFLVTREEPGFPLSPVLRIRRNRIGVAAASEAAIGNGASGIFIGPRTEQVLIADNVIAHNAHFGLAVAREARYIQIGVNRIFDHPLSAIDVGLDGPGETPAVRVETARYDAATNTTTITAAAPQDHWNRPTIFAFYGNDTVDADGYAEAEQFLGIAQASDSGVATLQLPGDLRGRYVNATLTYTFNADGSLLFFTRELVRAMRVE